MKTRNVLLVEDNNAISEIVSWILTEQGYTVTVTNHLPAKQLVSFEPDLIVLDEWIADMEGHMLCREIKATQKLAHVPVIIFSTASDIEALQERCGAEGFVRKPFDLEDLIGEVRRLLGAITVPAG